MRRKTRLKLYSILLLIVLCVTSINPVWAETPIGPNHEDGAEAIHNRAPASIFQAGITMTGSDGTKYTGSLNAGEFQIDITKFDWSVTPRVTELHNYNALLADAGFDVYYIPTLDQLPSDPSTLLNRISFGYKADGENMVSKVVRGFAAIDTTYFDDEAVFTNERLGDFDTTGEIVSPETSKHLGFGSPGTYSTIRKVTNGGVNNRAIELLGTDILLSEENYTFPGTESIEDQSMVSAYFDPLTYENYKLLYLQQGGSLASMDSVGQFMQQSYRYSLATDNDYITANTVVMDIYKALKQYLYTYNFYFMKTYQPVGDDGLVGMADDSAVMAMRNYNNSKVVTSIAQSIATSGSPDLGRDGHHYDSITYETPVVDTDAAITIMSTTRTNPDLYWDLCQQDMVFTGGSKNAVSYRDDIKSVSVNEAAGTPRFAAIDKVTDRVNPSPSSNETEPMPEPEPVPDTISDNDTPQPEPDTGTTTVSDPTIQNIITSNSYGEYRNVTDYAGQADSVSFVKGKNDPVTYGEFCAIARAMMELYGEPVMTEAEQLKMLQVYGFALPTDQTVEINNAIRYMAAKGIIDPTNVNFSEYIKFEDMLNLLIRIADPDSRLTFKELDINGQSNLYGQGYLSADLEGVSTIEDIQLVQNGFAEYEDYFIKSNDDYTNFRLLQSNEKGAAGSLVADNVCLYENGEPYTVQIQYGADEYPISQPTPFINCGITSDGYYHFKILTTYADAHSVIEIGYTDENHEYIADTRLTELPNSLPPNTTAFILGKDYKDKIDEYNARIALTQGVSMQPTLPTGTALSYQIESGGGIYLLASDLESLPVVPDAITGEKVPDEIPTDLHLCGATLTDYLHYSLDGKLWSHYSEDSYISDEEVPESETDLSMKMESQYTDAYRLMFARFNSIANGGVDALENCYNTPLATTDSSPNTDAAVLFQLQRGYLHSGNFSGFSFGGFNVDPYLKQLQTVGKASDVFYVNGKEYRFFLQGETDNTSTIVFVGCNSVSEFTNNFVAPTKRSVASSTVYYRNSANNTQDVLVSLADLKSLGLVTSATNIDTDPIRLICRNHTNVTLSQSGHYIIVGDTLYPIPEEETVYVRSNGTAYVNARALMGWASSKFAIVSTSGKIQLMVPSDDSKLNTAKMSQKQVFNLDGKSTTCLYGAASQGSGVMLTGNYPLANYIVVVNPYFSKAGADPDYLFYWLTDHIKIGDKELTVQSPGGNPQSVWSRLTDGAPFPTFTNTYACGCVPLSRTATANSKSANMFWMSKAVTNLDGTTTSNSNLGYTFKPPTFTNFETALSNIYSGKSGCPIVSVGSKLYNVYGNVFKTSSNDEGGLLSMDTLPSDLVNLSEGIGAPNLVAKLGNDMIWHVDNSRTYGASENGIYEEGSMIPSIAGAFASLRGNETGKLTNAVGSSNQVFYGNMYCTVTSQGGGAVLIHNHVLNDEASDLKFITSYRNSNSSAVYMYPTDELTFALNPEKRTVSMNYGDVSQIVDWDQYTFGRLVENLDSWTSIALLVFLVLLPRIAMWCYFILMAIAVMHDVRPVQVFCDKFIDPVKVLTFGKQDIHTINLKQILIQSILALALFWIIMDGHLLHFIAWSVEWGAALSQR